MGKPLTKEEQLQRDIEDYGGYPPLNKYIVDRAKRELEKLKPKIIDKPKEEIKKTIIKKEKKKWK